MKLLTHTLRKTYSCDESRLRASNDTVEGELLFLQVLGELSRLSVIRLSNHNENLVLPNEIHEVAFDGKNGKDQRKFTTVREPDSGSSCCGPCVKEYSDFFLWKWQSIITCSFPSRHRDEWKQSVLQCTPPPPGCSQDSLRQIWRRDPSI